MSYAPVHTRIPESPRWPGDDVYSADQWAFRCLMFYAGPLHRAPPGRGNPWQIQFSQVHIQSGSWRFLSVLPLFDAELKIPGIAVTEVIPIPKEFVAEVKFWTTPFYECKAGSNKAERVEYTHRNLMYHLRDPSTQEKLFVNTAADAFQFWRNLVALLVNVRIIAPESIQTFDAKVRTSFIPYNDPVSEAKALAQAYRALAAQTYRQLPI
ncbi:hypothetical protein B0J17DRAFT_708332 [Rhizoctonia solani]|nr:hypothetical protein B0J17DRAFT_708332 [Rhizoctonia solani]